jgi:uncharacterized damage-inducible protein DinB
MINRPQPDEYASFYQGYISQLEDGDVLQTLSSLKDSSYNFFMSLSPEKGDYAYADGKWTIKEVLGHLIDAERIFAYRALSFSREETSLPGFDENVYVQKATYSSRSLADIAAEFKTVRESNLFLFRSFSETQLTQKGIANGNPVSVRALVYITAGHELHHLQILKERYLS